MRLPRRRFLHLAASAVALAALPHLVLRTFAVLAFVVVTSSGSPAAAQDNWPSKPITVVVPFGAGSNTDSLARIYSARLLQVSASSS